MKYNPNGPLMQFLTKIADLMILNIVFVIACIPIFTIGAAWTALYYVSIKMVKDRQSLIVSAFIKSFKENFRQSTLLWLCVLALGALLFFDLWVVDMLPAAGAASAVRIVVLIILLLILMLLQYLFPIISRFHCTNLEAVRNSALMAIGNFPKTVLMCIITIVPVSLTLINDYTMLSGVFAWLAFAFALIAVANSCLLIKIFAKYFPSTDEDKSESEEE